jgi:hypothetical protein
MMGLVIRRVATGIVVGFVSVSCVEKTPTEPTDPVEISGNVVAMNSGESVTMSASGGDGTFSWVLTANPDEGALVPSADTRTAVLTAGPSAGEYRITVSSRGASATVSTSILTRLFEIRYIRPPNSITNPYYQGPPGRVNFNFRYANSQFLQRTGSCSTISWDASTNTLTCPDGLGGIPSGEHIVVVSDPARARFASSALNSGIAGSDVVADRIFIDGVELVPDKCPLEPWPEAARCAYFKR